MKIVCVIPARLASSRFPRKVLATLGDKPLLQWVWEAANDTKAFDEIAFAIDHPETARLIEQFGGKYFMTSPNHPSGTDRLVELQKTGQLAGDIWVNWQADEPFINREMIDDLLQTAPKQAYDLYTLKKALDGQVDDPHTVKVVSDLNGRALYFSRAPIPYCRSDGPVYKHIGIYAFTDAALTKVGAFAPTPLEKAEHLEQLRFLENGLTIQVHETQRDTLGIDTPQDLAEAALFLAARIP